MKRSRKKWTAIFLVAAMALMAASCGQKEPTGENLVKKDVAIERIRNRMAEFDRLQEEVLSSGGE